MAQSSSVAKKVWDSVNIYAVRCIECSKWRIISEKEKYEEIRERVGTQPFMCDTAREWRPNVSCEDESDIPQDNDHCWAMDKPNIPQTPPGWQRIIRLRAGGKKFADVYYVAPSNKRLRSMVEMERYLAENSKYQQEGISKSQFSFKAPVPLDENYAAIRRRRTVSASSDAVPVAEPSAAREDAEGHRVGPDVATSEVEAPPEPRDANVPEGKDDPL